MNDLVHKIILFLRTYPTEEEIERFYVNQILPHDKRSISEILGKCDCDCGTHEEVIDGTVVYYEKCR